MASQRVGEGSSDVAIGPIIRKVNHLRVDALSSWSWVLGALIPALVIGGFGFYGVAPYQVLQLTLYVIYGMLALSLTLVWGKAGIFSFGQAAFFGIGGYVYGVVAINLIDATGESFTALIGGALVAAIFSAILGYFMFYGGVSNVYVAIITLATTLVLFTVMSSTAGPRYAVGEARLGGYNGMIGIPALTVPWSNGVPLDPYGAYAVIVGITFFVLIGVAALLRSPFGRVLAAIRENEERTELLGYDVRRYKLIVFALGGGVAGLAGASFAAWGQFINPAVFGLAQAAIVIIWTLVGGHRSLAGAFVGVTVVEGLSTRLDSLVRGHTPLLLGILLVGVVLILPNGLVPSVVALFGRIRDRVQQRPTLGEDQELAAAVGPVPASTEQASTNGQGPVLETHEVAKAFGGLRAVNGVTLAFPSTGVHCLIGPNGAGKSTFFNLLVGRLAPGGGRIVLEGQDITRAHAHTRIQQGLGIKLQIPGVFDELSVRENVWLAAYAKAREQAAANARTESVLEWLGFTSRGEMPAEILAHGQRQWLEIGMVVGSAPRVVLLDEPTAGMSRDETMRTAGLVRKLSETASIVVVEHDMDFVRAVDAPVTVFHQGAIFAQGSIQELQANEKVLDIYLGKKTDVVRD
jgi:branched-chain amino acid transport system permease protein